MDKYDAPYIEVVNSEIMSCNSCYARNYDSQIIPALGKRVDLLYKVHIRSVSLTLCADCLTKIRAEINKVLTLDDEDGRTAEEAYAQLYEHTQHYIPTDDLWAFDMAMDALLERAESEEK